MDIAEIREDFAFLDSWEGRYEYIIDLGRDLGEFPDSQKREENRVKGCMSQVWLLLGWEGEGAARKLSIRAASDSSIVRGLAAILRVLYDGTPENELSGIEPSRVFEELGLSEHLSPSRRNGLVALQKRIRDFIDAGV